MLSITAAQFQLFADHQLQQFISDSVCALRAALPDETAALDDARLLATTTNNVAELRKLGFDNSGDITRALRMLFLLQYGNGQPRMPAHLATRFRSPSTSVEKKLEALEQVFIFGAGPPCLT